MVGFNFSFQVSACWTLLLFVYQAGTLRSHFFTRKIDFVVGVNILKTIDDNIGIRQDVIRLCENEGKITLKTSISLSN